MEFEGILCENKCFYMFLLPFTYQRETNIISKDQIVKSHINTGH